MSDHLPPMICAICQDALDRVANDDGMGWIHTFASLTERNDHDPVPITPDDNWRNGKCDFCADKPVLFVLPARDFRVPALNNHMSTGAWSACAVCADMIAHNDWNKLLTRALNTFVLVGGGTPDMYIDVVGTLYMALRENVTGPLVELP